MGYSYGTHWNDELIKSMFEEIIVAFKLDRMPSRSECEKYFHNCKLTSHISKESGGWYKWAERLGLPIKDSETGLGKQYEAVASEKLVSLGHEVEHMPQNFPYDLLIDGGVKADVKVSHLYEGPQGNFYTYNIEKRRCTCDMYILYMIGRDGEVADTLIIPSSFVAKNTQISVGEISSVYRKFSQRWDYIDAYSEFLNNGLRAM